MDQPAPLPIGRIGEADRAIVRHIGMPDHRSGMPAPLWAIPNDTSVVNTATASDPDHMVARRVDSMKDQAKPLGGVLVNLRAPTHASESRFLIQPRAHSQPQAKTNDTRMASATRVHIYWFFGGR
jgi:hypothetical protein